MPITIKNSRLKITSSKFINNWGVVPPIPPTGSVYRYNVINIGFQTPELNYTDAYGEPQTFIPPDVGIYYIIAQSGSLTDNYTGGDSPTTLMDMFLTDFADATLSFTEETITTTGTNTWAKPEGVTQVLVECWGGGGPGGGATTNNNGGGGGAGGAYARSLITYSSPSQSISYTVGATTNGTTGTVISGSNTSWDSNTVRAQGGQGGTANNGAGGTASTSISIGTKLYSGGDGAAGVGSTYSGGGGAGAGSVNGQSGFPDAFNESGGSPILEGGGGGANGLTATSANGNAGSAAGGGGSGGYKTTGANRSGGTGARGQIRLIYR